MTVPINFWQREAGSFITCTFARDEDECQAENFLATHAGYTLLRQEKLWPHKVRGEGHFAALFEKSGGDSGDFARIPKSKPDPREKLWRDFEKGFLNVKFDNLHVSGSTLYSLPEGAPLPRLQTLRAGVRLGTFEGNRFVPDHSLAMSLKSGEAEFFELDEDVQKPIFRASRSTAAAAAG